MTKFYNILFKCFVSLKLTLLLLITLGFSLFASMFIDPSNPAFNPSSNFINNALELNDIFHSWWFSLLILLLALNLIACSIIRFPKIWNDSLIPYKRLDSFITRKSSEYAYGYLNVNKNILFSKTESNWGTENVNYIFFEKHKFGRFGVYIIHLSLLIIMFGSITVSQRGIEGLLFIPKGQSDYILTIQGHNHSLFLHHLDFLIKCNDFRVKTYKDGDVMSYESDISIYKKNSTHPEISKTISLNNPLKYKNYILYQDSYKILKKKGPRRITIKINDIPCTIAVGDILIEKCPQLKEHILKHRLIKVYKHFKNYYSLGEAILVKSKSESFILLKNFNTHPVKFAESNYQYATGIKVCKNPGLSLVFSGFAVMMIGLVMAFGMNQRRYYAKLTTINKKNNIILVGICNRYPQSFKKEFSQIVYQHLFL